MSNKDNNHEFTYAKVGHAARQGEGVVAAPSTPQQGPYS